MNFLPQSFQKSEHYRHRDTDKQTDRQTDATANTTTPHLWTVTNSNNNHRGHCAETCLCLLSRLSLNLTASPSACDCLSYIANARCPPQLGQNRPPYPADARRLSTLSITIAATVTVRCAWSDATVATFRLAESRRRNKCCCQHDVVSFRLQQGFLNSGSGRGGQI